MRTFRTARPVARLRAGRADWYRIEAKASGSAEVLIYDEIGYFGITAQDFVRELSALQADTINVRLNTPGGEVFDGIAIYNALRSHSAHVDVTVDGLAASIGSVIAMAGDTITMARNSTIMIHEGHGMVIGNAADMSQMAALLEKTSDNIADIYSQRSGKPAAEFRDLMRAETWFSAPEAVAAGLADQVEGESTSPTGDFDLSVFSHAEQAPQASNNIDVPGFSADVFRRAVVTAAKERQ